MNANKKILFTICLGSSLVPFMGSALNLSLPYINKDFTLDTATLGWIPTAYLLSTAIFQIPFARLADMIGRKKVFLSGVFILIIFSVLSAFATSGLMLVIFRFLSGIGSSMMFGTNTAILTAAISPEKRGKAMGMLSATVYFSLAAGPFFGGIITQHFNWNSIFIVAAIISLVVAVCGIYFIKEDWKKEDKEKFDVFGSLMFAIGLSSFIYGFTAFPRLAGFIFVGIGIVALSIFSFYEKKIKFPVFNIKEFLTNRVFCFSSLSALINYSATFAISFILSLYLQNVRGLSPFDAGLFLIIQSLIQAVVSLKSGSLSDRISATILATFGMSIIAIGLVGLCFLSQDTSYYYLGALLFVLGIGFGIFASPNTTIIMNSVEKQFYGMASATMGTMRLTGQSISMGIAVMSISIVAGNINMSEMPHETFIISSRITFIIYFVLCLLGIYLSSIREKKNILPK